MYGHKENTTGLPGKKGERKKKRTEPMHDYCVRRPAGVGDLPIKIWPRFRLAGGGGIPIKNVWVSKNSKRKLCGHSRPTTEFRRAEQTLCDRRLFVFGTFRLLNGSIRSVSVYSFSAVRVTRVARKSSPFLFGGGNFFILRHG